MVNHVTQSANLNQPQPDKVSNTTTKKSYQVIADLEGLPNGWDGPGSKAPSKRVINALYQVFVSLNWEEHDIPQVEIEDDGSISMIWILNNGKVCSVDIFSDARTVLTHTGEKWNESVSKTVDPHKNEDVLKFFQSFDAV